MRSPRRLHALILVSMLSALVAVAPGQAELAAQNQPSNLVANPSFEEDARRTSLSSWVGNGWNPWFQPHHPSEPPGINWEPEFGIITDRPGQAHSGRRSQRWFNTWGVHNAGIWQQVRVPQDAEVTFSIWAFSWSSQQDTFGVSDSPYHKWVGIDPTGGTDPFSDRIVWSPRNSDMDRWVELSVTAQARSEVVTLFVRGKPEWPVKHNDILVDDALATYVVREALVAPPQVKDERYFPQTGYRVDDDRIWDYFNRRGGATVLGYPISRTARFLGQTAQFFQRQIIGIGPDGSVQPMNLLDADLMPYTRINGSTFPAADPALQAAAPRVGQPDYAEAITQFVRSSAPDEFEGKPVRFWETFLASVPADQAPEELRPLLALELWGVPLSRPQPDPANPGFIYLRFQRGIMQYDASCGCTQGLLLADYLKSILTGGDLPPDLELQARSGRFYRQYDRTSPSGLARPDQLPGTELRFAFEPTP